jgi:hypothetical protein
MDLEPDDTHNDAEDAQEVTPAGANVSTGGEKKGRFKVTNIPSSIILSSDEAAVETPLVDTEVDAKAVDREEASASGGVGQLNSSSEEKEIGAEKLVTAPKKTRFTVKKIPREVNAYLQ